MKTKKSAYAKKKKKETQISFAVTAKLINALVFATRIVHFLFFSSFYPASVNVQPAMCWTCSETTLLFFFHEMAHTLVIQMLLDTKNTLYMFPNLQLITHVTKTYNSTVKPHVIFFPNNISLRRLL